MTEAAVVLRCRRCGREMDSGQRVYCSAQCIGIDDATAARLVAHLTGLQRDFDQESSTVEAEIAQFAFERRRILREKAANLDRITAELAPVKANLDAAKALGEIRFDLASERPVMNGW